MPDDIASEFADRCLRKLLLQRVQLLQDDDIGLLLGEPPKDYRQPAIYAVHVAVRDLHCVIGSGIDVPGLIGQVAALCATPMTDSAGWVRDGLADRRFVTPMQLS